MNCPRELIDNPIWIKYYEMFNKYLELQELEKHRAFFEVNLNKGNENEI